MVEDLPRRFRSLPSARILGFDALIADSSVARLLGLAFLDHRPNLPALVFFGCRSVHTLGMRFPLDICLLDSHGDVLAWHWRVGPYRLVGSAGAHTILEIPVT